MLKGLWDGSTVSCLMFHGTRRLTREECQCSPQPTDEVTAGKGSGMHLFDLSDGLRKCESSCQAKPGQVSPSVSGTGR